MLPWRFVGKGRRARTTRLGRAGFQIETLAEEGTRLRPPPVAPRDRHARPLGSQEGTGPRLAAGRTHADHERYGSRYVEAEMHRLNGQLLLKQNNSSAARK